MTSRIETARRGASMLNGQPERQIVLLERINRTDIADAIRLGAQPMQTWFDWDHDGLPYFGNTMCGARLGVAVTGDRPGNFHHPSYSMSHIPGRWLDALLNAQAVVGIEIDAEAEATLRRWLVRSMSHRMSLPASLDLSSFAMIPVADLHNLREVMHGLAALCIYRKDAECAAIGERMIATIDNYLDFETGDWDEARFNAERGGYTFCSPPDVVEAAGWDNARHVEGIYFPQTFGRYLGALMRFHAATGSKAALEQAIRLRNHLINVTFADPSRYDVALFGGHTHSVTSTISGLARFAAATGDAEIFDRIDAMYCGLLADISNEFGWCTENWSRNDDYGEINNTADIVESLLLTGLSGRPHYLQIAEGMVRSHILPSQLRDSRFIKPGIQENLGPRSEGAFGFPCPYGLVQEAGGWVSYNWDIVGGGVSGLCEVLRLAVTRDDTLAGGPIISINAPFDGTYDGVQVTSPYSDGSDALRITVDAACTLRIRLSDWCEHLEFRVSKGSSDAITAVRAGTWLFVNGLSAGDELAVSYDLAVSQRDYRLKTGTLSAVWTGDMITSMDPGADKPLLFIPPTRANGASV